MLRILMVTSVQPRVRDFNEAKTANVSPGLVKLQNQSKAVDIALKFRKILDE